MSATSPPPIPPKPNSSEQDDAPSTDIEQILHLIDSELAAASSNAQSYPEVRPSLNNSNNSNYPTKQSTPATVNSTPQSANYPNPTTHSTSSRITAHTPVPYNTAGQHYPQPYPSVIQQQYYPPYYPYQQFNQPTFYPPYLASGWPPNTPNYPNVNSRPLPNPPVSSTPYAGRSLPYTNLYDYYSSPPAAYRPIPNSNVVIPPQFNMPQKFPMPDFNTYVDHPAHPTIPEANSHQMSYKPLPPPINLNRPPVIDSPNLGTPTSTSSPTTPYNAYPAGDVYSGPSVPQPHHIHTSSPHPPEKGPRLSGLQPQDPSSILGRSSSNPALLSNIALAFRATVKLGTHSKGALEYPESFTGADAVTTIYSLLTPETPRVIALHMARSLEAQLYFHSTNWSKITIIRDAEDEVYTFLNPDPGSPTAWEWDEDFPTGVFPSVGKCYSPRCGVDGKGCYSWTCPNYVPNEEDGRAEKSSLNRQFSAISVTSDISDTSTLVSQSQDRTWIGSVPKEILDKIDKEERKRQEIIFETIYTEEDYIKDLDLLEELYISGLRQANPPIIPQSRLEVFIQDVFYNVFDIRTHNKRMFEKLKGRQRESYVVEKIGDIFLQCATEFANDYILYNGHFPFADNLIRTEKLRNPDFKRFIEECTRRPEARRLDFRHFVQRPTQRLQRYTLLLEQIIKHTAEENLDKETLEAAWNTIKELCKESDAKVHETEKRLKLSELDQKLVKKNGDYCPELRLLDPDRRLIFRGELQKRSLEKVDLVVFLFDHYFVMTKQKKGNDGDIKYQISKKMIPLEMLKVESTEEAPPQRQQKTFGLGKKIGGQGALHAIDLEGQDNALHQRFTVTYLGRNGGTYQLFAESANLRKMWKEKITDAKNKLELSKSHQQVFELFTLNDLSFGYNPVANTPTGTSASSLWKGKVNCSVPFVTPEKRNMIAIGTDEGVWMGFGGENKTFRNVLRLDNVMQMAVLEEFGIFILLADKMLFAYSLEVMIPSSTTPAASGQTSKHPQRLSNSNSVQYFNVGTIRDRTLVVYMKKKGLESHFKVLEPIANTNEKSRRLFGLSKNDWFKENKQFYVPSESYSINFLRSKLCVVCARGFEILNLETLDNGTIPDFTSPEFATIAKKCENSKPLGMFRLNEDEFLLCYEDLFFYVDKHGELSRQKFVEWEGKPAAVAIQLPYVIGFDQQFIEVRHVQTGERAQIIPGTNMRCLNDNSSGRHAIHAVMQHPFTDAHYIFQLVMAEVRKRTL